MGMALNSTNHPIAYACSWPYYVWLQTGKHVRLINQLINQSINPQADYSQIVQKCNIWRNFHDIQINYQSILAVIDFYTENQDMLAEIHGPGHWNDPDMVSD